MEEEKETPKVKQSPLSHFSPWLRGFLDKVGAPSSNFLLLLYHFLVSEYFLSSNNYYDSHSTIKKKKVRKKASFKRKTIFE
jgi:hypothetical protein